MPCETSMSRSLLALAWSLLAWERKTSRMCVTHVSAAPAPAHCPFEHGLKKPSYQSYRRIVTLANRRRRTHYRIFFLRVLMRIFLRAITRRRTVGGELGCLDPTTRLRAATACRS